MSVTVVCDNKNCMYTTDIETTSETNPSHCPKCGGELFFDGTDVPLYDDKGNINHQSE